MRRALLLFGIICLSVSFVDCGGSSSNPANTPVTSKIANRVFLLNSLPPAQNGLPTPAQINILNGDTDSFSAFSISIGGSPTMMRRAGPEKTLIYGTSGLFTVITNSTETADQSVTLSGDGRDLAGTSDGKLGFVAMHNVGQIAVVDLSNGSVSAISGIPSVSRLVVSGDNSTLLAFSDDSDSVTLVKLSDGAKTIVGGFDRAYTGQFSSDNSKAYILSCGAECGGTTAMVSVLDLATNTVTSSVPVSGATVGLLDGSTLYVAGNSGSGGTLDVLTTNPLAVSTSGVPISDGLHTTMALMPNSKLYVGAKSCSNLTQGCLSFYNTSTKTATVESQTFGSVTDMTAIKGRNVAYVTEGNELRIYDTTTDTLQSRQLDIVGKAIQVLNVP